MTDTKKMQKKIALVVQRCGKDIVAGAEVYAYDLAQALSQNTDGRPVSVDIYSSQSDDYIAWNNRLPQEELVNPNFKIKRFPVTHSRLVNLFRITRLLSVFFNKYLKVFYLLFSKTFDFIFLKSQGPWCPDLWKELNQNINDYSLIIVKSYLYAPNVKSILQSHKKAKILFIVTAHDEPEFKLKFVENCIRKSYALGFVSLAEEKLCEKIWPISIGKPHFILPPGIKPTPEDFIQNCNETNVRPKVQALLQKKFFLSLGRIDKNKNIPFLFTHTPQNHLVVFAGESHLSIPNDSRFIYIGKVTEQEKHLLLKHAISLLMVSRLEAYSIVTAEALSLGCFVLALKGCLPVDELIERYGGLSVEIKDFSFTMQDLYENKINKELVKPKSDLILKEKSWQANVEKILTLSGTYSC
jgi:glycosyltransferase involved in cell wall biosynthesis